MFLDLKLNSQKYSLNMLNKVDKTIRPSSFLTIYKSFIRPHLDYGNNAIKHIMRVFNKK